MKIAVFVPKHYGGTGLYRLYLPHELMSQWGHDILFTDSPFPESYNDVDIFVCSKSWFVQIRSLIPHLKKKGIQTVIDYDDYWVLPSTHYLYDAYKAQGTSKILRDALKLFDHAICTTEILEKKVRVVNKSTMVLPNAVDPTLSQFKINTKPSDSVRFGWIGGTCHYPDLLLLDGTPQKLKGDFKMVLFGHDGQKGGVYDRYCNILSGRGTIFDPDPEKSKFKLYKQAPARFYTQFYNLIDVALAPLVKDEFNSMKSELKMIEAGFFKKGVVVSNVLPYTTLINNKNCIAVDHKTGWAKAMNRMIKNPSMVEDMGEELYLTVKDQFDLRKVTKAREQWYSSLL